MTRRKYCCDSSRQTYENYYLAQSGDGLPIFVGSRGQRGHGLGSMLSGLFRSAAPVVKSGLATLGKSALKTGLNIARDVLDGEPVGQAAKKRLSETIKEHVQGKKPPNNNRRAAVHKVKRRKVHSDIFD